MDLARRTTSLLAVIWTLLVAGTAAAQTGQQGEGFIILCRDGVTIMAGATSADPNGIVKVPLGSAKALWRAMPDRIADVGTRGRRQRGCAHHKQLQHCLRVLEGHREAAMAQRALV